MFERGTIQLLVVWKTDVSRKPLIIRGARQAGKMWALKYFGWKHFGDVVYLSLDKDESGLCDILKTTKNPECIIWQLFLLHGRKINPQTILLILDKVQECSEALNSLRYFCEEVLEYTVACAGPLFGIYLNHIGNFFPVGEANHLSMYPLIFTEFLNTKDPVMYQYMCSAKEIAPLPQIFFDKLREAPIAHSICGGIPEPASLMVDFNDMRKMDSSLRDILNDYALDSMKHATPTLTPCINYVWDSLPSQLVKENRKSVYQLARPGIRAREYEDAVSWLEQVGLVNRAVLSKSPRLSLKAYDDLSTSKLYALDTGLLRQLSELGASVLLLSTPGHTEYKGALAENYTLQSFTTQFQVPSRYWTSGNKAEVDFLLQHGNHIYPIGVKADQNITGKSLIQYEKLYQPVCRIRYSMLNLK